MTRLSLMSNFALVLSLSSASLASVRGDDLQDAVHAGDVAEEEALLQAHPDWIASKPELLPEVAEAGHIDLVTWLLNHHADVNARDPLEMTALHQATISGKEDVVKLLLDHGADVTAVDMTGLTTLHKAAQMGRTKIAEMLLAHHADVNAKGAKSFWKGETPLYLAAENGLIEVVKLLVTHGADLTATDQNGLTALQIAQKNHHLDVVAVLQNPAKAMADEASPPAPADGVSPAEVISKLMTAVAKKPPGPVENFVTNETIVTFKGLAQFTNSNVSPRDSIAESYNKITITDTPASMYGKGKGAIYFCKAKLTPAGVAEYRENPPGKASTWQLTDGKKEGPVQTGPVIDFIPGDCDYVDATVPESGKVFASFCLVQEQGKWRVHCVYLSAKPLAGGNRDFAVRALSEFASKL